MNYASFLKDFKENTSINQLGSKLKKNISDLKSQTNIPQVSLLAQVFN